MISAISLFLLSLIVKFLSAMKSDFLKDIQQGVDYIYENQTKLNYIYKRLKKTEKKNEQ
tara:strand:- start:275 stop:451 length:177 start_codon:yes stop_codon:yes gene_type:complete